VTIQSLGFGAIRLVQLMSRDADAFIDDPAQTIDRTEWLVFRQCMPRREREVLAERQLFRTVEFLLRNVYGRDPIEGRIGLGPERPCVLDIEIFRRARLDHEVHTRVARC